MLTVVNELINKFKKNINQIISNSDNTFEDIKNEAFIVVNDNYSKILDNEKVFVNELRTRCLKFNKYGKRIERKERWEVFNNREKELTLECKNNLDIDEDLFCELEDIKNYLGEYNYNFLIYYYTYGCKETSEKYNMKEPNVRKRVSLLIKDVRRELC